MQYRLTQEQLRELDDAVSHCIIMIISLCSYAYLQENEKEYLIELAKKLPVQMISRSGL